MKPQNENWQSLDAQYLWHPYSSMTSDAPVFAVESAKGVKLKLADGRELIDGMSSWWCTVHGYNHPRLNAALQSQMHKMSHVMFGGLTHEPASRLAARLVELTPPGLDNVFFADSGSVAVEVALKMALQYWIGKGQSEKNRFVSLRQAYHGDTFGAMSVCDPHNGMHHLFASLLPQQFFVDAPARRFGEDCSDVDMQQVRDLFSQHHAEIAALIVEPIVQGAGGMTFYSADYLKRLRDLCDEFDILLIADEIATGFGRSGKLFACEHAAISPDIQCVGKALTGGVMTLSATLTSREIARSISENPPHVFMHGPTFMANPLACAVANASIDLLLESDWQGNVNRIERGLQAGLQRCADLPAVSEVRVLGAIGVVELHQPVDMKTIQPAFVDQGVWVRPFGKLVYLMPPFIITDGDLTRLTQAVFDVVSALR